MRAGDVNPRGAIFCNCDVPRKPEMIATTLAYRDGRIPMQPQKG
jgi:hypothetical protein